MLSHRKPIFEGFFKPFLNLFSGVDPNILTLIGSIPPVLFFVFMLYHWFIPALIVFLGNALDLLDGMVARNFHKVSPFGGFLDSTLDRLSDFLLISAFAFCGIVRWELAGPLICFAFLTSYARSRVESLKPGIKFTVGIMERGERLCGLFLAILFFILFPKVSFSGLSSTEYIFMALTILSGITVLQRIISARSLLK